MPTTGYAHPWESYSRATNDLRADLDAEDDRPYASRETAWREGDEDDRPTRDELDADERAWWR